MKQSRRKLKILVADSHDLFRRGVRAALETRTGWEVIEVATARDALERAKSFHPHIAVLEMQVPGLVGLEAAVRIRKLMPKVEILFIGTDESEHAIARALSVGAKGYITRSTAARDLMDAVLSLAKHQPFFANARFRSFSSKRRKK